MIGSVYLPIGPWPEGLFETLWQRTLFTKAIGNDFAETQILHYVGTLVRQNFLNIHRAWHPILRQYHMNQETLNEWSRQVETGEVIKFGSRSSLSDSNATSTTQN
jgi:hypothetical protein